MSLYKFSVYGLVFYVENGRTKRYGGDGVDSLIYRT